jgi:hypothetical protein
LLEAIRRRSETRLFSSPTLIAELALVLTRATAAKRLAMIGKTAREVLADYVEAVDLVEPALVPRVVPGDADDDQSLPPRWRPGLIASSQAMQICFR